MLASPSLMALAAAHMNLNPLIIGGAYDVKQPVPRPSLEALHRRITASRTAPHQGKGECARRLRQRAKIAARHASACLARQEAATAA
jgi:hypothetical protein